jgi:ATP-dependent helicase/nuclease subunit A
MKPMTAALACDPNRSVVVEACAGSGKTWLLTARIARALLEGCAPGGILALTFTNKAAEEMQARVWLALEELSQASPEQARILCEQWGVPPSRIESCVRAAPHVFERLLMSTEQPFVGTFHAWYLRLLAFAPMGFSRLSRLSPTQRPTLLRRQAWRRWTQKLNPDQREMLAWLSRQLGASRLQPALWSAVSWAGQVESHMSGGWRSLTPALTPDDAARENDLDRQRWVEEVTNDARDLAQAFGLLGEDRRAHAEAFLMLSEGASQEVGIPALEKLLLTEDKTAQPGRKQQRLKATLIRKRDRAAWAARTQDPEAQLMLFVEGLNALAQRRSHRLQQARQYAVMTLAEDLAQAYEGVCGLMDETDFDGIEAAVLQLLRSEDGLEILARWDCRTQQILVDEFQDTSPAQWALLRSWLEAHVGSDRPQASAPRVFLVGDPKQSIYQFRGGDPRVFEAARIWLEQRYEAEILAADQTRRCGKEVVDLLNAVMPALMNTAGQPSRYRIHQTLSPPTAGGVFHLPLVRKGAGSGTEHAPLDWLQRDWLSEPRSAKGHSPHFEEGQRIAAFLRHMHEHGPQLAWSKMRVLVRARTHLAAIEAALAEASIPFVSDRSGGLLDDPIVLDLLALCRLMVYPFSDQDFAHVACSPLFECPIQELPRLLTAARARGLSALDHVVTIDDAELGPLNPAWTTLQGRLREWLRLAQNLPIHDFLSRAVDQSGLEETLGRRLPTFQAAQAAANLQAFLGFSLQWEGGRQPSLSRFVHDLEDRRSGVQEEQPGLGVPDQQWDAVSLQSLHAAKGLESELVVLACAAAGGRTDTALRWIPGWTEARDRVEFLDAWLSQDWLSTEQLARLERQHAESQSEAVNLLYVAITRAKRYFAVSGVEGDGDWYAQVSAHTQAWESTP